jgi:hypothetical protein
MDLFGREKPLGVPFRVGFLLELHVDRQLVLVHEANGLPKAARIPRQSLFRRKCARHRFFGLGFPAPGDFGAEGIDFLEAPLVVLDLGRPHELFVVLWLCSPSTSPRRTAASSN